jgi:multifunctional methyltransferase subunit TRM112
MKILTLNFLTCARKACKASPASFPLHPTDAELEIVEAPANPLFLANMLPRLEWGALRAVCGELGLPGLAEEAPEPEALWEDDDRAEGRQQDTEMDGARDDAGRQTAEAEGEDASEEEGEGEEERRRPTQLARDLHRLLLETTVKSGKLVCGNCGHQYAVMDGIANFLLPAHLV